MQRRPHRYALVPLVTWLLGGSPALAAGTLDLSRAVVLHPPSLSRQEHKALDMLVDEVRKRSQITWETATNWPAADAPSIVLSQRTAARAWLPELAPALSGLDEPGPAEGFRLRVTTLRGAAAVLVLGNDERGLLFGAGQLLRKLELAPGKIMLAENLDVVSAPKYRLRGHQLGYRPKTHAYDAWDVPQWEQYVRDLAVFGCNAVELIPPRSDDDAASPHFPLPPMAMLIAMSRLLDDYGLDVWLWYPAMDRDYADPATVTAALKEWSDVFRQMPRLDAVFVPGGDPGHTRPSVLMALLEKQTAQLHQLHPKAQMWVSPQGFTQEWLEEFLGILERDQPAWLTGVVFGPQVRVSLAQLRERVPTKYPIRHYPDITHCRQCQYPVPDWDVAFAITEGREGINPRPLGYAAICRQTLPSTVGFITYSEGCNDDVNKTVWSALGWDPAANVLEVLREYSRYYLGERYTDDFAQGLLALERNWQGPLLPNEQVLTTLHEFQALERAAAPRDKLNWRFQMALYRAYYDAYLRSRLVYETGLEERAYEALRQTAQRGSLATVAEAEGVLERATTARVATDWRARVFELAEALFQSIRMQLSVERYQAIAVDRGASLDTLDYPLNNRPWLRERFAQVRLQKNEAERHRTLEETLHWADPGPGGFYDDLGNLGAQPRLVRGPGPPTDPDFRNSSLVGFEEGDVVDEPDEKPLGALRMSWITHAESLYDAPLELRYTGLDPTAQYRLRVVYAGDSPKRKIRLVANDGLEVHPLMQKPWPIRPVEFPVARAATATGALTLRWFREAGLGANGRGCQVSEVWLMKFK